MTCQDCLINWPLYRSGCQSCETRAKESVMISMFDNVMVFNGPADPYAEAKAAFADGELQYRHLWNGNWVDWIATWPPAYDSHPSKYRRRPKPDEATTEPSVLQEHANLIAKLDEAEGDGWWGDFGYTPASDRNGIANEAMRQAMTTQKPAEPEPKPKAPDGVFEVAPMGRNPRGWGI